MANKKSFVTIDLTSLKDRQAVVDNMRGLKLNMARINFNFAIAVAYALGEEIPSHVNADGKEFESHVFNYAFANATELADVVGMHKGTISKTLKALKGVIDGGHFDDFANGTYEFSYDKLWYISDRENKLLEKYTYGDLMRFGLPSLRKIYAEMVKEDENKALTDSTDKGGLNKGGSTEKEGEVLPSNVLRFSWDGNAYECSDKKAIEEFIKNHCEMK